MADGKQLSLYNLSACRTLVAGTNRQGRDRLHLRSHQWVMPSGAIWCSEACSRTGC